MKRFDRAGLLAHFTAEQRPQIEEMLKRAGVSGMIVFQNLQLDSSARGDVTGVIYGPSCTYKVPEQAQWLNDAPSRRQYPIGYYEKETLA